MTTTLLRTVTGWPAAVNTDAGDSVGRVTVEVPTTRPLALREMSVPLTVMAGAFGISVVPAINTPLLRTVPTCPAAVKTDARDSVGNESFDVPINRPPGP